nr:immunoglobulin heavy chain junction region [Mus musculus]
CARESLITTVPDYW